MNVNSGIDRWVTNPGNYKSFACSLDVKRRHSMRMDSAK
jgi:hypothetical protein